MKLRIAVVGGGISGLAAANKLIGCGHDIHVFESTRKFGGKLSTESVDGFLIETGADSFVASRPRIVSLCDELGLSDQLIKTADPRRKAFIYWRGTLQPIPEGFSGLVPTRFAPVLRTRLLSPAGKARLLAEPFVPVNRSLDDESLKSFATRRFGKEAYERLLEPLLAGVSSSEGDQLSLTAALPHWKTAELEYGSVIKGILKSRPGQTSDPRTSGFLSLKNGTSALINALVDRLASNGATLVTDKRAERLQFLDDSYRLSFANGETQQFDGVILAVPAWETAKLVESVDLELGRTLKSIPQASSMLVTLAYEDPAIATKLKGTGYLVPWVEGRQIGGTTWSSSKWQGRAPDGTSLIRVYFARSSVQKMISSPDHVVVDTAKAELREVLGIESEPTLHRISRWVDSTPQFTIGHLDRVACIEQRVGMFKGLGIAGNMLRGIGIPVCVQTGEAAAAIVLGSLRSS